MAIRCARDDGLGRRAAEALARRPLPDGVEVLTCHQLTVELARRSARRPGLADRRRRRRPAGRESCASRAANRRAAGPVLHSLDPSALLACAEALYDAAPRTLLWTVTARSFDYAETLSPEVERALPALLAPGGGVHRGPVRACD